MDDDHQEHEDAQELLHSRNRQIEDMAAIIREKKQALEQMKKAKDQLQTAKEGIIFRISQRVGLSHLETIN